MLHKLLAAAQVNIALLDEELPEVVTNIDGEASIREAIQDFELEVSR